MGFFCPFESVFCPLHYVKWGIVSKIAISLIIIFLQMFSFFANANIPHQVCSYLRHPVRIFSTKFYVGDLTKSCSLLFRPWINHGSILSLFYHLNTVVSFCWLFFWYLLFSFFFHRHPSTINSLSHPSFFSLGICFFHCWFFHNCAFCSDSVE